MKIYAHPSIIIHLKLLFNIICVMGLFLICLARELLFLLSRIALGTVS